MYKGIFVELLMNSVIPVTTTTELILYCKFTLNTLERRYYNASAQICALVLW